MTKIKKLDIKSKIHKKKFKKNNIFSKKDTNKLKNLRKSSVSFASFNVEKDQLKNKNKQKDEHIKTFPKNSEAELNNENKVKIYTVQPMRSPGRSRKSNKLVKERKSEVTTELPKTSSVFIPTTLESFKKSKSRRDIVFDEIQGTLLLSSPCDDDSNTTEKIQKKSTRNTLISSVKPKNKIQHATENNKEVANTVVLENTFNLSVEQIRKAITTVIKLREGNKKFQKQLIDDKIPLFLQISCHNMPKGHQKIFRIPVPNRILDSDDEICLIVGNIKGINSRNYEQHLEHYKKSLGENNVTNINKIMTLTEFRNEYETFEQKMRLVDLYEMFLVDSRICGKVAGKCGKIFYKKRKIPTPVKLQQTNVKFQIEKALSKVFFHMHLKGNSHIVQFGHHKMDVDCLVENLFSIINYLNKEFPGGFENIKGIHVYTLGAKSIPVYMSMKKSNEVPVPIMNIKKPKAYKSYTDELTTLPDAIVTVTPRGLVMVRKTKKENESMEKAETNDENIDDKVVANRKADKKAAEVKKKRKLQNKTENVVSKKKSKYLNVSEKVV